MSWSEELCRLCLTVSNVPIALPKDSLYNYVQNHAGIKIVDSGTVDGIESDSSLTRWVLLLPSEKDVQYMIGEVQNEQVEVNEKSFTIVYQKAIACELPDRWEDTYKKLTDKNTHGTEEQTIQEQSEQAPNTDSFNAEPPPGQGNPAYHHPHMYSSGYPVGPYGAMSGFYVNVPQHENTPQGRTDLTNTRQVDQNTSGQIQQTQMPFMQMPHPAYNRFGPPRPGYPHQGQIQPQNQPTSQSNQNFRQDQSHMRGPFPYNVPFPGYPVYPPMGMPQGGNIPFHPGMMQMPMMFDQHSGQFVPVSSAGMPSAPPMSPLDSSKGSADETRNEHSDPPPPYNSHEYGYSKPTEAKQRIFGEHTETTFPSRAISDQDKEFRKFRDPSFADSQDRTGEGDAQSEKEAPVSQDIEEKREKSDTTVERPTKILVSNLPSTAHEDFLELFFENTRKYGGGPVFHIELDEENASAVIEFEDSDAVERVLTKCPIKMMGQEVDVQIYVPEPPPPRCTIEVTGPPDVICEDQLSLLEMYFENERRSGGGAVVEAVYDADKNMALITFETENVALRVEEKAKHSVKQQNVFVKLHIPETNQKKLKKTESVEEGANMQKEKPKCMVKVKGVDKSASRDTFEFYFENERRSGGGEIDVIKSDEEEDDVLYVTFKKPEVAKRVADREHSVENQNLKASLFEPPKQPPCYDDRVLIKGLNPSTTQDCLFNFIEAKTGLIPDKLDYHAETEGVAMVTFLLGQGDEEFDFEKLVRVFSKNKLEGASLKIARVPVSNCILVSNLAQEVTKDTVEFYFENVRKSGGGQVQKVVMNEDDSCLVFFQDYLVIDAVVQREHTLINQKLEVLRFQECLCKPEGEIAERKLRIPEAVFISDVDVSKVKFLTASKANTEAIKTQLEACHTIIIWQQQQGNVMLQCTITSKTPDCYKLVKVWREKAMKNFEDFMKLIVVHKVPVLQEIWHKVMEELKTVTIEKPDAVALFVDKSDGVVTIVGYKLVADSLAKKINEIAKRVMEEAEKEKHKVKEVVTNLKPVETKMLLADKFPTKMESQFSELKVKINQGKNEITFEGMLGDVQGAKIKMYEMKSSFAFATVESVSTNKLELYHQKQTKEHIVKKLKANGVVAVWEVTDNNLTVVSLSEDQLQISKNLILQSVIDKSIALKPSSKSVMSSEQWNIKKDELHTVNAGRCLIAVDEIDSKIHVCGTDDIVVDVFDSVNNYLRLHTVGEEKIPCTKHVHRLIERFHKDEISKITKELQNYHVQIISLDNYGGFEIRGTEDGIRQAKAKLDSLLNRVRYHEELLTKPGLGEHMQTPKGKDSLNTIETQLKCVVTVKTEDENDERFRLQGEAAANFGNKGVVITACCKAFDTRKIYTVKGDMTELTVDAFVNPADDKLSLSGGLGKAFLQKGGKSIMQECAEFIKSEGHLGDGELFVSKAGNLQAKVIVHVIGPVWKGGMNKEEEMLSEAVFKCLMQASSRNLKSIALPAISCGSFGYPLKKATMTIVQSVKNFFREEQESTLDDVYLCDVKQDTVEGYNEALGKEFGPHNLQHMQKPSTSDFNEDEDDDGTIRPMNSDEEEYYASNSQAPRLPQRGGATNESEVFVGKIKVSVVKGELAKQKVDLIVNTTAKNLDLKNGAVSLSLLKCGGPELQQEVSQKYPNGIKDGEIAVTSGQKLNCSAVVHTSLGNWDQANDTGCIKTLHALMNNCLNVAERKNLKSVAFPAIGTGNLGYPRDVVAAEMFAGVSQFSDKTQQPCVKEVRFIVYQKDFSTIKAFEDELKRWATGSQRGTTVGKERQTRNFDAYEDLRTGRQQLFKDDDSDSDIIGMQTDDTWREKATFKSKQKGAEYSSPRKGIKRLLDPKYWLEDEDIDRASKLIKNCKTNIAGLEDVCVVSSGHGSRNRSPFIQILHSHGHHWVTATNIGCKIRTVKVYDSMYRTFDRFCLKQILGISPYDASDGVDIELAEFQRQRNKTDCGLFAVAAAFSLVGGTDPSLEKYDLKRMRENLYDCFVQNVLLPFPSYIGEVSKQRSKTYKVALCIVCKDLLDINEADVAMKCGKCYKFCHLPNKLSQDPCAILNCCRKCY